LSALFEPVSVAGVMSGTVGVDGGVASITIGSVSDVVGLTPSLIVDFAVPGPSTSALAFTVEVNVPVGLQIAFDVAVWAGVALSVKRTVIVSPGAVHVPETG
jgi:hypothetical protein